MITGGQAAVRSLLAHGVTDLFGVPGIQLDPFYNAMYDEGRPLAVYTARHEQGSAYMALGYAATSDRVGVLAVVPGPGLLNAAAGMATAWAMSLPVVTLCGQVPSPAIDRGMGLLHEIPGQPSIVAPFTRARARASSPGEISGLIAESFAAAVSADPRPVFLELPPDVLAGSCDEPISAPLAPSHPAVVDADVEAAAQLLLSARSPMLVVGGGAQAASESVRLLAERLGAPVLAHRRGRGVLDSRHRLSISMVEGQELWADVDCVVAIGSRMYTPLREWGADEHLSQIWVDPDPDAPARVGDPTVHLRCRAEDALPVLFDRLGASPAIDASERLDAARSRAREVLAPLGPQQEFLQAIRSALPDDGILVSDLTQVGYLSRVDYEVRAPKTYLFPAYMGTLGWALPTALGAKVANPDRSVAAVMGDGGFGFTGMELATAVHYGIGVTTIVFDNEGYGNVRMLQREAYGGRVHATDLRTPDLLEFAASFGVEGIRAETPDALHAALTRTTDATTPALIWVPHGDWPNPWPILGPRRVRG